MQGAGKTADDIDIVIPVGGSSRLVPIRERLKDKFGVVKVLQVADPDEIVARGAAIQAAALTGALKAFRLHDIAPHSVGIKTRNGCNKDLFSPIILAGNNLPFDYTETFYIRPNESAIKIEVRHG